MIRHKLHIQSENSLIHKLLARIQEVAKESQDPSLLELLSFLAIREEEHTHIPAKWEHWKIPEEEEESSLKMNVATYLA